MATAVVAVLALAVGLVLGWGVGGAASGDDDDNDTADADDSEGHSDHPDDVATDEDDGFAELLADHHYHAPPDEPLDSETQQLLTFQVTALNDEFVGKYPTAAAARDDGWERTGPFIPGLGTHYLDPDYRFAIPTSMDGDEDDSDEVDEVMVLLIFEDLEDDAPLAGFMLIMVEGDENVPGFAGPYDTWHHHTNSCYVEIDGIIESPFVADQENVTEEMCTDIGGEFLEVTTDMAHVWSVPGYESELGLFSEVNPRLTCPNGTYHRVPYDQLETLETTCRS